MTEKTAGTLTIRAVLRDELSKGLEGVRVRLLGVRDSLRKLGADVDPIASRFAAGFAAVATVAGFRASIAAAREAVDAEARLLAALKGRREELERIKVAADDIQSTTLFEGDELIAQAATLVNMGNAAARIPEQLQAAVDTAAALGLEVAEVVRAIGLFRTGEFGRLGTKVPQLQKLKEEGRLAADGVRELLTLFGGAAAAQANNDFGKIAQTTNKIGDQVERIGAEIAKVQAGVLQGTLAIVERIADAVTSPAGSTIVELIASAAPSLTQAAVAIGAIVTGTIAWATVGKPVVAVLGSVLSFVGSILSGIGGIVKIAGGLVLRFFPWIALLTVAVKLLDGMLFTSEELAQGGGLISRGWSKVKDLAAVVVDFLGRMVKNAPLVGAYLEAGFKVAGAAFTAFVSTPVLELFGALGSVVEATGALIRDTFKLAVTEGIEAGLELALPKLKGFGVARGAISGAISSALGTSSADARKAITEDLEKIKSAFPSAIGTMSRAVEQFRRDLATTGIELQESLDEIGRARDRADVAALQGQIKRLAGLDSEREAVFAQISALRQLRETIASLDQPGNLDPAKIRKLLQTVDAASGNALAEIIRSRLDRAISSGTIEASRALEVVREIELARAEQRVKSAQILVDTLRAEVEQSRTLLEQATEQASIMLLQGKSAAEIADHLRKQGDALATANEKAAALLEAEQELSTAASEAAKAQEKFAAATTKASGGVVDRAEAARRELDDALQRSADLAKTGALSGTAAVEQQKAALEKFRAVLVGIRAELDAIASKFPELTPEIERARKKIDDLGTGIKTLADTSDDFVGGFKEGLRQGSSQLDDLRDLGREVGSDLADSLGEGVIDVFVRGRKTFREWLSDVLFGVAELLAKFAAFKALSSVLNLSGNGLNDGVAANVNVAAGTVTVNGGTTSTAASSAVDVAGEVLTDKTEGGFLSSLAGFFGFGSGDKAAAATDPNAAEEAGFLSKLGSFFGVGEEGSFLSSITSSITGLFTGGGPLSFLGTLGSSLLSGGSSLLGGLGGLGSSALSGLGSLGTGALSVLGPALAPLTGGLSALLPAIMPMLSGLIEPLMSGIMSFLPQLLGPLLGSITSFLPALLGGGGFGGLFETLLSFAPLLLLADGGPIPGPWTGKDDRIIGVGGEEYVHRAKATRYYGLAAMDAINRQLVPRELLAPWMRRGAGAAVAMSGFDAGGPVTRAGAGRREEGDGQVVKAVVAPSEEAAAAIFKGGERSLLDFIGTHSKSIKMLLDAS